MSPVPTTIHLDELSISEPTAARLTAATIQHILFLKNQIPFPVAQLNRLPIPLDSKSSKRRVDLLDAVDTLSCHLDSTFSALSSSLALNSHQYPQGFGHAQVHLLILLGPSLFVPRSRILLTIDGLKVQACETEREVSPHLRDENQCGGGNISRLNRTHMLNQVRLPLSSMLPPTTNVARGNDPGSTEPIIVPGGPSSISTKSSDPSSSPPDVAPAGHLGEQQTLSAAERLLSRSLAIACAEDGVTLNAELEPTQMHILIQAPRRFHHPAWIPRQNMSPVLDSVLPASQCDGKTFKKGRAGAKTDEIVICCDYTKVSAVTRGGPNNPEADADDLIWWSWDGKIVGFGDL